jgi:hypothetical protein
VKANQIPGTDNSIPVEKPWKIPSAKRLHNYGKPPFFMGKSTISMAMFHSYVKLPESNGKKQHQNAMFSALKWAIRSVRYQGVTPACQHPIAL